MSGTEVVGELAAHNLPVELTRFVGRSADVADVAAALADTRLVTLTGPGGCGKTRLATRVAADVLDRYPHGVRLVELAALTDGRLVPALVAQALGVRERPGATPHDTLVAALRERGTLIVLDNCEHLLDAAAQTVATLLRSCPWLRVLATSRQPLGVAGELVWRVPPMDPDDAAALFTDRARLRQPAFSLNPGRAAAVREICRGLDGLPLAIELACGRVGVLGVEEIAAMLSDQLALLTGDGHVEPRHRSLQATLAWSHDLLDAPQRALFARLAVFTGWWDRHVVDAVAADLGGAAAPGLLAALVDRSLVLAETLGEPGAEGRYRMLEPVRQFALARLNDRGDAQPARAAHARSLTELAERAAPLLRGPEQLRWLRRLDDAEPDLRAALAWLLAAGERERAASLGWSLWLYWWLRGRFTEGRAAMEQALAAPLPARAHARAAFVAATMACGQADYEWAGEQLGDAVALFRQVHDDQGEAYALSSAGFAAVGAGRLARGVALLEVGVDVALAAGERWAAAFMLCFLATVARDGGDPARAAELGERGLELSRSVGDREGAAMASYLLAGLARDDGDEVGAARRFGEGLTLAAEVGDVTNVVFCLQGLAGITASRQRAVRLWAAADALLAGTDPAGYIYRPDQEPVRRAVAQARADLGDVAFDAEWAAGRALPPSELLEFALRRAGAPTARGADPDGLTSREAQILELIAAGRANKQIAGTLAISVSTVEQHVSRLYVKIGARCRADAAVHALRRSVRALA
ncbi:MAG: ATP-binding protein [Pseudonocardia sp.]